jgi:hypothetical protein
LQLTWSIDTQAITPICEDFTAGSLNGSIRQALLATDLLHELYCDALQ